MDQIDTIWTSESSDELMDYVYLLWSWMWLIILTGLFAGIAALIISLQATPIYETSTRLLVSDPPSLRNLDSTQITNTQTMTSTYAEMLVDRPVLQKVIDQLSLPITSDNLKPNISVDIVRNTQLILIQVRDPNPIQAADIANTLAVVFTDRIRELQSQRYATTKDSLSQQIKEMEKQVNDTSAAISNETDPAQKLQLEARLTEYQGLYSNLVTNYEQVSLAEAQTSTNIFVSEPASIPREPISPKTTLYTILAIVAGMIFATSFVIILDTLDDTVKNPEEIRKAFDLPILGLIANHQAPDKKPISLLQPRSPVAEAFRSVRTNLTFSAVDKPLRRILITSATPQEGKTTVSANLAVVLAQGEKKAVLIDADLRRPQVHTRFELSNHIGLSSLFLRQIDIIPSVVQTTEMPGLSVISSGTIPPNPSELLTSRRMTEILDRLNETYDLILIDTPPVLTVTDAVALAPALDGVVLVAKSGTTKMSALKQTIDQMHNVGARILGVVLNDVNPASRRYGHYYHQYYSKYTSYYEQAPAKNKKTTRSVELNNSI